MERREKSNKYNDRSHKTRELTIVSLNEYALESFPLFLVNLKALNMLMWGMVSCIMYS